jgi:hypothetical protein
LLRNYRGLGFANNEEPFETHTILEDKMHWKLFRGGGRCFFGEPEEYDGTNGGVLEPFLIHKERTHSLVAEVEQPLLLNV